ncbi:hypothetical protein [Microcoleus sp. Pol10D4]|uniref:hypothetical protein n=1 Tax=Microcoleus sp. Pol10D4 TaxID=3055387 RepID=UPI002FD1D0B3
MNMTVQYEPDALIFLKNNNINVQLFTNHLQQFINPNGQNINPNGGNMQFNFNNQNYQVTYGVVNNNVFMVNQIV